jgi:DNA-binding transcriptional regulator YiaG
MDSFTTAVAGHRRRLPNKKAEVIIDISEETELLNTKATLAKRITTMERQIEEMRRALAGVQADLARLLSTDP